MNWWMIIVPAITAVVSGAAAAGGAYAAVRVQLSHLRRDVDRHEGELGKLHSRINRLIAFYKSS